MDDSRAAHWSCLPRVKTGQNFVGDVNQSGQVRTGKAVDGESRMEPESLGSMAGHRMQLVRELALPNKTLDPAIAATALAAQCQRH